MKNNNNAVQNLVRMFDEVLDMYMESEIGMICEFSGKNVNEDLTELEKKVNGIRSGFCEEVNKFENIW